MFLKNQSGFSYKKIFKSKLRINLRERFIKGVIRRFERGTIRRRLEKELEKELEKGLEQ